MAVRSLFNIKTLGGKAAIAGTLFAVLAAAPVLFPQPAWSQTAKPAAKPAATSKPDDGLRQRVQQLEEQLVDMQVVIGTLETLARSNTSAAPPQAGGFATSAGPDPRVSGMETQIRALTAQIEQLSRQVRELSGGQRPRTDVGGASAVAPVGQWSPPPAAVAGATSPDVGGFGATTVTPGANPDLAPGASSGPQTAGWPEQPQSTANLQTGVATQDLGDVGAKSMYETAYGFLLQQDYGAAQTAFSDFLARYPGDQLAGNAQFWLGESHFVRGQYKAAAGAFLKGYEQYGKSAKAPDSLLKLAMSLERLGQKDAACSSLSELNSRFPKASQLVKKRASAERRRVGC